MLLFSRYLVFGFLIICNAIICSVAVWNLSFAQSINQTLQVDAFLTFLGAFAVMFILSILFIEILQRNTVTGRIWFEILWVGLFWIMELSGAAAVTALAPNLFCTQSALAGKDACTSTHVLLAFSWLSAVIFLVYLICLVCATIIRHQQDPQIWHSGVIEFYRSDSRHGLNSAPNSPVLPRFHKIPEVIAPQPRRPPPTAVYAYRSGMGPEYRIEHFHPSSSAAERPVSPILAAAPLQPVHQSSRAAFARSLVLAPSLYPQHVRSSLTSHQPSRPSGASPPPLGDWPRPNAVDQPLRSKRKPPPVPFKFPAGDNIDVVPGTISSLNSSSMHPSRPSGLRTGLNSNEARRPPPLDLTRISAFRGGGDSSI